MSNWQNLKAFLLRLVAATAVIVVLAYLSGCITPQRCAKYWPVPQPDTSSITTLTIKETLHDTTVVLEADSSYYVLWLLCDSGSRVVIADKENTPGKRVTTGYNISHTDSGVLFRGHAWVDSMAIYLAYLSLDTSLKQSTTIKAYYRQLVPAQLTWWERTKIKFGGYAILALALLIGSNIIFKYFIKPRT